MINRRGFVARIGGLLATGVYSVPALAQLSRLSVRPTPITVYKSSSCGCCAKWVEYLRENGFDPTVKDEADMDRIRNELGVPEGVRSCHTAVVGKYLIEGHVPVADIRRLLAEQPKVAGLAAPGMPAQSPGMAPAGAKPRDYEVVAFQADGATRTFSRY